MGAKSAPKTCKWGQKEPPKPQSGGRKRPRTNQSRKSVEAKSAVKMQKWGQKAPSKQQSDGKKRHHSDKREKSHGGGKCHHISNCGGTLTTTYYIQGAGAPAKTKNYVNADGVYIFSGKGPTFSASCKTYKQNFWKG